MSPRVGLILRSNARGLATQTQMAWRNYPFAAGLHVLDGSTRWPEYLWRPRFPKLITEARRRNGLLDPREVHRFLAAVDVVFSVETLYDWRLTDWAHAHQAVTVVQGNPELVPHHREPKLTHPDVWTWPTNWFLDDTPEGPVVPVPVGGDCTAKAADAYSDPFTVVHIGGHRAIGDRNGTESFVRAINRITKPCLVRVYGQDGQLPELPRLQRGVTVEMYPDGVDDRWSMFDGAHLVVLPRRYGGNNMVAYEAMEAGCALAMSDCPPNRTWPIEPIPTNRGRVVRTPGGEIRTHDCRPDRIGGVIDKLNVNRDTLADLQEGSRHWAMANTWEHLKPRYDALFEQAAMR